ncbi:hypothetical protein ACH61_01783 [Rathayibacter tanaceti]|uniref:Uncharacterized protein n=1 Tax=Rathayibacter tanaceti TaxID=1671680 RepID=A0A166HS40_9MICO|nr:hypothetical protein ACH61_01783 [Rathayibacter tanaceti]
MLGFEEAADGSDEFDPLAELSRQEEALAGAAEAGRLRLLLAAESVGALIAREIAAAGLPCAPTSTIVF